MATKSEKTKFRKMTYGVASFGWAGSAKHWQRHEMLSLVLEIRINFSFLPKPMGTVRARPLKFYASRLRDF